MKKSLLLHALCVAFICLCGKANAQWEQANSGLTLNQVNSFATVGSTIFAATGNISGNGHGVFKSTDNGDSWTAVNTGFLTLDVRQIIAVGSTLYAAVAGVNPTDGGVYISTDMGDTWAQSNTGLYRNYAYSICHVFGTLYTSIYGDQSEKWVYTSTDEGANWTLTTDPVLNNNTTKAAVMIGGNIVLASDGGQGGVFLSTDNGVTWSESSLAGGSDGLAIIGTTVFAATGTGVHKSVDNGVNWTQTTNVAGVIDNATALIAVGNTLFAARPNGNVYSSDDSGTTWTYVSEGAGGSLTTEGFGVDANYLYAGTNLTSVGVWRRALSDFDIPSVPNAPTDLGLTPQKVQLSGQIVLDWTDNSSNEDGFTIERSLDGIDWSTIGTSTDPTYTDNGLENATLYYYQVAAYNGIGNSAYSNIASGSTLTTAIATSKDENTLSIFPNPSNGRFVLTFDGEENIGRQLTIFNAHGESISSQAILQLSQQIDLTSYTKGIYLLNIREGETSRTQKIMIE